MGERELAHQQVQEQVKPAEAAVGAPQRATHQEIDNKIREVVGLAGPMEYLMKSGLEGLLDYHLGENEYQDYQQGCGPAWGGRTAKERTGVEETKRERLKMTFPLLLGILDTI